MSELSDIMRSAEYIRLYTSLASSGVQKGIVYIEDALDRIFWERIFDSVFPNRYEVKPYSQPGAEGKRKLEQEYGNLHRHLLVAVDADYDYLCPERNDFAAVLNNNPFIIHTYFYSKESYIHTSDSIDSLTNSVHLNVQTEHQINQALQFYSGIIYDAFCHFSWLHNRDAQQFPENEFNQSIQLPEGIRVLSDDLTINEEAFAPLRESAENYVNQHVQYINDEIGFANHRDKLSELGLLPNNTLLFTNGHTLLDKIFRPVYDMYLRQCRKNDSDWVVANYPVPQQRSRLNQVRNHYVDNCKASTLIHHCQAYKTGLFWNKIAQKISQIE